MSQILIFGIVDLAASLAKLEAYVMVIWQMILFFSKGVISSGRGMALKSGKLSTEITRALMRGLVSRNLLRRLWVMVLKVVGIAM